MALLNPAPGQPKSERAWFRQYLIIDGGSYVIGRDNTGLTLEFAWDETDELNVLGEAITSNILTGGTVEVDPYYLREDDELSELLLTLVSKLKSGDDLRVKYGHVYIPKGATGSITENVLYMDGVILYNSIGGDSGDGAAVPYTIKLLIGTEVDASFNIAEETFTAVTTP